MVSYLLILGTQLGLVCRPVGLPGAYPLLRMRLPGVDVIQFLYYRVFMPEFPSGDPFFRGLPIEAVLDVFDSQTPAGQQYLLDHGIGTMLTRESLATGDERLRYIARLYLIAAADNRTDWAIISHLDLEFTQRELE